MEEKARLEKKQQKSKFLTCAKSRPQNIALPNHAQSPLFWTLHATLFRVLNERGGEYDEHDENDGIGTR